MLRGHTDRRSALNSIALISSRHSGSRVRRTSLAALYVFIRNMRSLLSSNSAVHYTLNCAARREPMRSPAYPRALHRQPNHAIPNSVCAQLTSGTYTMGRNIAGRRLPTFILGIPSIFSASPAINSPPVPDMSATTASLKSG